MALTCFSAKHPTSGRCIAYVLFILLAMSNIGRGQTNNEIVYVYDELGRLVAVIDTAGEAAVYSYDAVGNLLSISRYSASVVSIVEFTPNSGPIGATVTIYGTGFSTTPSQNSVTFNGVAATVNTATTTKITTTVPVGATTGPIAITTPAGTASSSTSFVVGGSGLPTITDFTPTIGVSGAAFFGDETRFGPNGTIYIASDLGSIAAGLGLSSFEQHQRTYVHEFGNLLSRRISPDGSARTFGKPGGVPHASDPTLAHDDDTGAYLEECVFGNMYP